MSLKAVRARLENRMLAIEIKEPSMCSGAGPVISEMLRQFGPPDAARQHFQPARVEMLKGVRAVLDKHIQDISKPAASTRGSKVSID